MNPGLWRKAARETWLATVICGVGVMIFLGLLTILLPLVFDEFAAQWLRSPIGRLMVSALLGGSGEQNLGVRSLQAIAWVQPIFLLTMTAHAIAICTRVPSGEIDRGTIDVFLALPISRGQIARAEFVVFALSSLAVILCAVTGVFAGSRFVAPGHRPPYAPFFPICLNLYLLHLNVGGMAFFFSCLTERRQRAMGATFAVFLISFLISFVVQLWPPADGIAFLSVLTYYRPLPLFLGGAWPVADYAFLVVFGAIAWLAGMWLFGRRQIATI
ncbi:MAG: ABC transporter permease subunit [Planctomycetes bacterium]|nr:ABC transporter permease subunit [Planctomycetota bacterium]